MITMPLVDDIHQQYAHLLPQYVNHLLMSHNYQNTYVKSGWDELCICVTGAPSQEQQMVMEVADTVNGLVADGDLMSVSYGLQRMNTNPDICIWMVVQVQKSMISYLEAKWTYALEQNNTSPNPHPKNGRLFTGQQVERNPNPPTIGGWPSITKPKGPDSGHNFTKKCTCGCASIGLMDPKYHSSWCDVQP
jgi:hypothetical protein